MSIERVELSTRYIVQQRLSWNGVEYDPEDAERRTLPEGTTEAQVRYNLDMGRVREFTIPTVIRVAASESE